MAGRSFNYQLVTMKTIIAPTDFTDVSLNAVNYAADMTADLNAKLILLHVVSLTAAAISEFPMAEVTYFQPGHEQELNDLKNTLLKRTNNTIQIETKHLFGNVNYELKQTCSELNPFVVVMATNSTSAADRFLFGSTTLYSVAHLQFPVMVVPDKTAYKSVKKIALATDLKGIYGVPLEDLKTITHAFNASLQVVHVQLENENPSSLITEKTLLQHRLKNLNASFENIKSDTVEKGIEKFAIENNIDLILLLPKKHGLFHRSQSKQVIFHLPVPAMTIHEE